MNFGIIALAALLPLVLGFLWYHPMTFGKAWMGAAGVTEQERPTGGRMAFTFIMTYVLSFLAALAIRSVVIHQAHLFSILIDEPGFRDKGTGEIIATSEIGMLYNNFMAKFGNNFRTFKHGALHGTLIALFLVMPVMAINAMFERKGFKYIAINVGYWTVALALMGGIVCAFS
jgi:hypothetical protein